MYPTHSIVQNAANSREHRILVAAIRAAGLEQTLSGAGPYTLFAPTDEAFGRLPQGTVETLMAPSNQALLAQIVNYHLVLGRKSRADIAADIRAGGGAATYRTAQGGIIRVTMDGSRIVVGDVHGNRSHLAQADVAQSNGMMHVLSGVLLPAT
jgi:uncharacterized surface protein with fasciclin (FAS1) repeats